MKEINKFSGGNASPVLLGVNIDHVATLRQARLTRYPESVQAALVAEQGGADGITAHLREDRRHMQDYDIKLLKDMIHTRLNLEMAITDEMVAIAKKLRPAACCLVPEKRQELTTEGGLDITGHLDQVKVVCDTLGNAGCQVSLFIDPVRDQIDAAAEVGAPVIELHTGRYADASVEAERVAELMRIQEAAEYADQLGLQVNAGHGLHYHNVGAIAKIPQVVELNIGHSIISRAIFSGLQKAVSDMKRLMREARNS